MSDDRAGIARRKRRGVALLEVLIALVLLAVLGVGWITLMGQLRVAIHQVRATEREVLDASRLLDGVSLWSRSDFDGRTGTSRTAGFTLHVQPVGPRLYSVIVADTLQDAPLLGTTFYPRDGRNATP